MSEDYDFTGVDRDRLANELHRSLRARLEVMEMMGKKCVEEYREQVARSLLTASLTLIPSDHLQDHQFVVSRGVYEKAKKLVEKEGGRV
jgi:hypothetical protein